MKILLLGFFVLINCIAFAQTDKPNIIYIMVDDMGYADLSGYGRKEYKTPNLDKLASQGMKFTNAYSASSLCTPTRTAFMTGRYPGKTTVGLFEPLRTTSKDSVVGLSAADNPLPLQLKKHGYETALIGKWHLGYQPQFSPNANGFDEFFGFHPGAIDYISHASRAGTPLLFHNNTPVKENGYFTDILGKKVVEFIQRKHAKPFFLSVQFNAPHWPWQESSDRVYPDTTLWPSGGSPKTFAGMMVSLDNAVGKILAALDESKLTKSTVVIFTSDNGGERFSDMGGLRGKKYDFFEGGIRVPAFVRWPGVITANAQTEQVAITMDWNATILALAGVDYDKTQHDGLNLIPVLKGNVKIIDRTLFWRMGQVRQQQAVRDGKWKFVLDKDGECLFDLSEDQGEKNNLKDKHPGIFMELKNKYANWERTLLKTIPL